MMRASARRTIAAALAFVSLPVPHAFAYRPFVSTDAAVTPPKTLELELGYFALARSQDEDRMGAPQAVLNWGAAERFEVVGEFVVLHPQRGSNRVVDAALALKGVL